MFKEMWVNRPTEKKPDGQGGFGAVYLLQSPMGKLYAFKIVSRPSNEDCEDKNPYACNEQFESISKEWVGDKFQLAMWREVAIHQLAASQGLAPTFYTVFFTDTECVMVMDALKETFDEVIQQRRQKKATPLLTADEVDSIEHLFEGIGRINIFLNDRDGLKKNIMVSEEGRWYLIDFGLARTLNVFDVANYGPNRNAVFFTKLNEITGGKVNQRNGIRENGMFLDSIEKYETKYGVSIDLKSKTTKERILRLEKRLHR